MCGYSEAAGGPVNSLFQETSSECLASIRQWTKRGDYKRGPVEETDTEIDNSKYGKYNGRWPVESQKHS